MTGVGLALACKTSDSRTFCTIDSASSADGGDKWPHPLAFANEHRTYRWMTSAEPSSSSSTDFADSVNRLSGRNG
jgi:hypothetical protein